MPNTATGLEATLPDTVRKKGVLSTLVTSIDIAVRDTTTVYRVDMEDAAPHEVVFFDHVRHALEGVVIYKRFGEGGKLHQKEFSPIGDLKPEQCGYGVRRMRLDSKLKGFELRGEKNNVVNGRVSVEELQRVVVPPITTELVRVYKTEKSTLLGQALLAGGEEGGTFVNKDTKRTEDEKKLKMLEATLYPFMLVCKESTQDFIARSYEEFKLVTNAFEALIKQKKNLAKLAKRITVC